MVAREMRNLFSVENAEERMSDANVLLHVDLHCQGTCVAGTCVTGTCVTGTWSSQAKMRCGGIGVGVKGGHRPSSISITATHGPSIASSPWARSLWRAFGTVLAGISCLISNDKFSKMSALNRSGGS